MNIDSGLRGEASLTVAAQDTARAMRSGSVDTLATPRVIALCEEAAVDAIKGHLTAGVTSVGMRVQLDHLQPTAIGGTVEAEAVLERVEGRRLTFTVSASDAKGLVACGRVTRVIVETDRFLDKAH